MSTSFVTAVATLCIFVPVFHLWLHALLSFWKKHPILLYAFGGILCIGVFGLVTLFDSMSPIFLRPSSAMHTAGGALMAIGIGLAVFSCATLGPRRFFVWAVLRPSSAPKQRITRGPFRLFPHPAYIGYVLMTLGNLLANSDRLYLLWIFLFSIVVTPLVIYLKEHELSKRVGA